MTSPVRVGLIGVGGMARYHIRQLLKMQSTTRIVALCEPSEAMALEAAKVFVEVGLPPPPNQPDWQKFIAEYGTRTVTFRDGQVVADRAVARRRVADAELAALPAAEAV